MYRTILGVTVVALIAFVPSIAVAEIQTPVNQSGIDVVFALDNSGSMASSDPKFLLHSAASRFAADLPAVRPLLGSDLRRREQACTSVESPCR